MILVAGSANLDFVVRAGHIPAPGETVLGRDFKTFPGGKGANQAVACARAGGVDTAMLLALGNDAFAVPLEASLQGAGVRLHIKRSSDQPTGTAFICVSDDAENAITVAPGANNTLRPSDMVDLKGVSHLVMQLETPINTVLAYAKAARASGVKVVLNAAPAQPLSPEMLAALDILVVNEGELAVVSGHAGSIEEALARVPVPCVVVTLGSHGSLARVQSVDDIKGVKVAPIIRQPAFPITPVDTTGAGDTFVGSFVAALSQGAPLQEALETASAASALACLVAGAQASIPTRTQVQDFLKQQRSN